jgi:hypothetical protein
VGGGQRQREQETIAEHASWRRYHAHLRERVGA